jgi:hypothetical protein
MHTQYEPAADSAAQFRFEATYVFELPRSRDFHARLNAAGPLSDEDYRLLVEHHRQASPAEPEPLPAPGIAAHVLPEGWNKRGA